MCILIKISLLLSNPCAYPLTAGQSQGIAPTIMITTLEKSWQSFNPVNQGSDIIKKKSGQPQPSAHFFQKC